MTHKILSSLDVDNYEIIQLNISFEEQFIRMTVEPPDEDEEQTVVLFRGVHSFWTNRPSVIAFPNPRIVTLHWERHAQWYQADIFLAVGHTAVFILTVCFEAIEVYDMNYPEL